jgi:hypothetical protein
MIANIRQPKLPFITAEMISKKKIVEQNKTTNPTKPKKKKKK